MTDNNKTGWVIIGRSQPPCKWCEKAQKRLEDFGAVYEVFYYDEHKVLLDFLVFQGLSTVPQVYHRGTHVGGYENLGEYLSILEPNGRLVGGFDQLENYLGSLGE